MPKKPERQSSTSSSLYGISANGAVVVLSLIKETTDVFPPLKSAAAIALALVEGVKQFKSNKEDWGDFGELVVQRIAFLVDRLNGNYARASPNLLKDLEHLAK